MKKGIILLCILSFNVVLLKAQQNLSLEDCRKMALEHNKTLKISEQEIAMAEAMKKIAFAQYMPNISATAAYIHNNDNISLISEDKYSPVGTVMPDGSFGFTKDQVNNKWTTIDGKDVPLDADEKPFNPKEDPDKIKWKGHAILPKEEFTVDIKNMFVGTVSLIQPIYLGGKIRELNKMANYGKNIAEMKHEGESSDILYSVDVAYWQIVSISNKLKLAEQFKTLVDKLNSDINEMVTEGVATKSDKLKVKVKANEADLNVLKAQNGLSLSKMTLCQLIGMPMDAQFKLTDEDVKIEDADKVSIPNDLAIQDALEKRSEIRLLLELNKVSKSEVKIAQSAFMPTIAATANYLVTNPNTFDGFTKEFFGTWNVGVMVQVPIFHWGERRHKLTAAKFEHNISEYKLEEAKEKIELQVRQSNYKITEANKRLSMTNENLSSAAENLYSAEEGYKEGVITLSDLISAQTAWQAAQSENIDAKIDAKLCKVYLEKATGNLK